MTQKLPSLTSFIEDVKKIYGKNLKSIILFGSYARNEARPDSDVDILVLVDLDEPLLKKKDNDLFDASYEVTLSSGIDVMPMAISKKKFDKWKYVHPFYQNICEDGVILYEAA